jgi:hypothetical protein
MDLRSVASVIARHKTAALAGVLLALGLTFVAAFKIDASSFPGIERRQPTIYASKSRLFVTQQGFPWGRSALHYQTAAGQPPTLEGDPDRFASLAVLYAELANSGRVQHVLNKKDRETMAVVAKVVPVSQFNSAPLPMLDITGKAESPTRARALAKTVTTSLISFIKQSQASSGIRMRERVVLEVIDPAALGKVSDAPSPALPALVLLTVLFATLGGIFVIDNWRQGVGHIEAIEPTATGAVADEEKTATASAADLRSRFTRPPPVSSTVSRRPTLTAAGDE